MIPLLCSRGEAKIRQETLPDLDLIINTRSVWCNLNMNLDSFRATSFRCSSYQTVTLPPPLTWPLKPILIWSNSDFVFLPGFLKSNTYFVTFLKIRSVSFDYRLQKYVQKAIKWRLEQAKIFFPQWKLLNKKCEVQLTSSETYLKILLETWPMSHAFNPIPKGHLQMTKGLYNQFPALCSHAVRAVCCIMTLKHLLLFLWFCYPYSNAFGSNGNYAAALLSQDNTVINLCHCCTHGYNNCSQKGPMEVAVFGSGF